MANFFDQFDAPAAPAPKAAPPAAAGNFFDQFDAPAPASQAGAAVRAPGEVTTPQPNPFTPDTAQDRALTALAPFFERGVSARNSSGQWTDEARARLTKEGIDPLTLDQRGERDLQAKWDATQRTGSDAAAVGRGLLNGIPIAGPAVLGGANRMAAFIRSVQNGTSYSDELKNVEAFGERTAAASPKSTIGGELAGGVLGTAPLVAAAPAAFGAGTGSLLARSAASAATGGLMGAADAGVRSGGDMDAAVKGGITGGALGWVAPGVGAAAGRAAEAVASRIKPGEAVPTIGDLKTTAREAYKRADDAGLQISQPSFADAVKEIGDDLRKMGLDRDIHPKTTAALGRLEEAAATAPTLQNIDTLRKVARSAASSVEPAEKALGSALIDKLDDFVGRLGPDDVVAGNAEAAVSALKDARTNWGRARRAEQVDTALEKAERQAASTGSGGNANNATRQAIRRILDNPKLSAGYSVAEMAEMEAIVRGGPVQNALRLIGKLSPQGNGLMAALGLGATAANPMMAAAPIAGMVAKKIADRGTANSVQRLNNLVRSGGEVPVSPLALPAREGTEQLARFLTAPLPAYADQLLLGR